MSRSRRKTPVFGHTLAESESADKRIWNKRLRARVRDELIVDAEEHIPTTLRGVSNVWDGAKDSKHYWAAGSGTKAMRK